MTHATRLAALLAALVIGVVPLAAQQKVPLVLHHLAITIDSATWSDIAASPLMRKQFAGGVGDYTLDAPSTPAGQAFVGKYNYLQIGRPIPGAPHPGMVRIVFSSETLGGLEALAARGPFTRTVVDGSQFRWGDITAGFQDLRLATSDSASLSVNEWTAAAARGMTSRDSLPPGDITNRRFFARWFDSTKYMARVTSATLAIPVGDIARIAHVLKGDGVSVVAEGEGAIITLDGFTLHLIPPYRGAGVKQLQFALTHAAPANPTYRFGPKSQLRFGPGLIAVWDFESK